MSEEVEQESTGKSFKGILITLASTITLGVGGFVTNKLTGGKEEEKPAAAQPSIIINNSQQQQAAQGKTVVIKEKATEAKPAATQPVAKPKKKEGDEFKEEKTQW